MKWLLLSVCFIVGYSQTVPDIPETFQVNVDIEIHSDETSFGSGMIARDESKGWGVEDIWIKEGPNNVSQLRLERYDMGMVYLLRSNDRRCEIRNVTGSLPPYFKWVSCASYTGKVKVREYEYDEWSLPGPGGSFDVFIDSDKPNVPAYVNTEVGITRRNAVYRDFVTTTPSADIFAVPKECQQ